MCHKYQCLRNRDDYKNRFVKDALHCSGNRKFKALVEENGRSGKNDGRGNGMVGEWGWSRNGDTTALSDYSCPLDS
uniref:Uncharacterized protein n=1 Tax=Romanomermis culicivorax TaxID=13658 RepID=A0A915LE23_ROMCU